MPHSRSRRQFLARTAAGGALAAAGELSFLSALRPIAAEETQVKPGHVRLRPEIEPLVRLVEESPRDRLLERMAEEIRRGTSYREVLAALMLAGVRNIKPRPVGFKFHAVLVVNSAHQASLASADRDRWLPLFWALDYFKGSQARDVQEGDWTMSALPDSALPSPDQARRRFVEAMDRWDEEGADAAVAQLARTAPAGEVWEMFWRYGARDFRDIGHKAIYVANACRTLQVIGREHSEPVLRSLAFALLMRGNVNPAEADEPADRPWRRNLERAKELGPGALHGTRVDPAATRELLSALHSGSPDDAAGRAAALLKSGVAPASVWDGVMAGAGELLMRKPGIVGIHCVTTANALHYAYSAAASDETRLMMLLQGAAFMPLFREAMGDPGDVRLDRLEPLAMQSSGPAAVEEVLADVSRSRMDAARKALGYLEAGGSAEELLAAARRLIFLKGTDSHDYKFSSAALEDYYHVSPEWRNRFLASAMFNLRGAGDRDNPLTGRIRAALSG
ncbi:MAG: twin-arginine translocation signal domain-containing protein [Armatimonadota bacterium]